MAERVVEFEDAVAIVAGEATGLGLVEAVGLLAARGRWLAEAVRADRDQPPFDRATRDGFAVRAGEFSAGVRLVVVGEVRAGEVWRGKALAEGEAVRIMTGAPVPAGADAVAMVEHVEVLAGSVQALAGRALVVGENIVPQGGEARAGALVMEAGVRVGAAEIALAAACGCAELRVARRPRVAIVATGDELVELDTRPEACQIRNSNSYALAALVEAAGGEAVRLAIARDVREEIAARLAEARECDLVLLSGGVSMGEYDLVEEVLSAAGAEFLFTGVRMQPGKPVVFGRLGGGHFFGLPGNPISTQVTFHCFVEPFLRAMLGGVAGGPAWVLGRLGVDVAGKAGLTRVLPARMEGVEVRVVGWQGSGDLAANARANCYVRLEPGVSYAAGEVVRVLLR